MLIIVSINRSKEKIPILGIIYSMIDASIKMHFILEKKMEKYTEDLRISNKPELDSLLSQRKAPLSEEGLNKVLQKLTLFMSKEVFFFGALYPKTDKKDESILACNEIDKADMMEGTDGERYYPVFSSIDKLKNWKPKLQKGEYYYILTKNDLLSFLDLNQKVAAVVMNPQEDDLLLHRMLLQNLIQVGKDNN